MDEQLKKKEKVQDLFLTFLRIGAFTFGGGYAMIPLIHREMVDQKKWITEDEMMDMVAISESTPGPIAINAATFVGAHVAGKKGAVAATAGVCIPSFLTMLGLSYVLSTFESRRIVQYAFIGIRASVLVLIFFAWLGMLQQMKRSVINWIMLITTVVVVEFFSVNPVAVILISFFLGVVHTLIWSGKKVKK